MARLNLVTEGRDHQSTFGPALLNRGDAARVFGISGVPRLRRHVKVIREAQFPFQRPQKPAMLEMKWTCLSEHERTHNGRSRILSL
jgi:hypothetical protein